MVYSSKKRFENQTATLNESISFAFSRIHLIVAWSVMSATVGLVLRIIERLAHRLNIIGKVIVAVLTSILGKEIIKINGILF